MELTMIGRLVDCALLAFRTPAESVRHLVPEELHLVTEGPWAFWNVVACRIVHMRPSFVPEWAGVTYCHVAYRLYVRAHTREQGEVPGIYFVRSDADARVLGVTGNWLSDFRFHTADVALTLTEAGAYSLDVRSDDPAAPALLRAQRAAASTFAPHTSCFPDEATARATLKYQPLGLATSPDGHLLKLAEVLRDEAAWHEDDLEISEARFGFFEQLGQDDLHLELATLVVPLPYTWRLGRTLSL